MNPTQIFSVLLPFIAITPFKLTTLWLLQTNNLHSLAKHKTGFLELKKLNYVLTTVKPLITNTSKEFIKCRILHFLIMECCRYLVF